MLEQTGRWSTAGSCAGPKDPTPTKVPVLLVSRLHAAFLVQEIAATQPPDDEDRPEFASTTQQPDMKRRNDIFVILFASLLRSEALARTPPAFHSRSRGGGSNIDDDLDAYIDNLIASVEDDSGEEVANVEGNSGDDQDDSERGNENSAEEDRANENVTSDGGDDDDDHDDSDHEEEESEKAQAIDMSEELEVDDLDESGEPVELDVADEDEVEVELPGLDKQTDKVNDEGGREGTGEEAKEPAQRFDQASKSVPDTPQLRPARPPNALYRFWLRQGLLGHSIVMTMVLCNELVATYLPQLGKLLAWLWDFVFPARVGYNQRNDTGQDDMQQAAVGIRTGVSGKQKRELTRQADQAALQQLKMVGNVHEAKYRHVSLAFQRRHNLGAQFFENEGKEMSEAVVAQVANRDEGDDEEDDDVNWVVQALTEEKKVKKRRTPKIQSSLSVGVGSKGPSFTVGVDFGGSGGDEARRQSVAHAVTAASRRKKKRATGPRPSDRDGGDGLLGRIRAVAGTDSLLSRSLLGAYPGDAVPPGEAASPDGVTALARKYGWGDWSDEEQESSRGKRRVKRRRRKIRLEPDSHSSSFGFDVSDSDEPEFRRSLRRLEIKPDPPLSSSSILSSSKHGGGTRKSRVTMVRPAMEQLDESSATRYTGES